MQVSCTLHISGFRWYSKIPLSFSPRLGEASGVARAENERERNLLIKKYNNYASSPMMIKSDSAGYAFEQLPIS